MSQSEPVHFMVDIESWDTQASAIILSIGGCLVHSAPETLPTFYYEVRVDNQYMRSKSMATMQWWESQGNCPCNGTIELYYALEELSKYLHQFSSTPIVWSKGTDFDIAVLANAYNQSHLPTPWKYHDVRDFRTVKKLFGASLISTIENTDPHHALQDAVFQAKQLHALGLELK